MSSNVVEADDACENRRDASLRDRERVFPANFPANERACEQATAQCSERQASFHFRLISNGRSYMYIRSCGSACGSSRLAHACVNTFDLVTRSTAVTLLMSSSIRITNFPFATHNISVCS